MNIIIGTCSHTPAVNSAVGVMSYQSALLRFVRFRQVCSLLASRIQSSRRQPVNLWDGRVAWSSYCATTTFGIMQVEHKHEHQRKTERWSETVKIVGSPALNGYSLYVDRTWYNS